MKIISTILFGTDLSFVSEYAMGHALTLARGFEARLVILHAINVSLELCRAHEPDRSFEKIRAGIVSRGEQLLDEFCARRLRYWNSLHDSDFTDYVECAVIGDPHKELLKKAVEVNADLLVIGTHSRHEIDPHLFGSTAEKVLRSSPCPVITVRPPFWMICMKFRDNPSLPLARHGSFITVRSGDNPSGPGKPGDGGFERGEPEKT